MITSAGALKPRRFFAAYEAVEGECGRITQSNQKPFAFLLRKAIIVVGVCQIAKNDSVIA